jgi:hypothetical protein
MLIYPDTKFEIPVGLYKHIRRRGDRLKVRKKVYGYVLTFIHKQRPMGYMEAEYERVLKPLLEINPEELPRLKLTIPKERIPRHYIIDWRLST